MKLRRFTFCEKMLFLLAGELFLIIIFGMLSLLLAYDKIMFSESWKSAAEIFLLLLIAALTILFFCAWRNVKQYIAVCVKIQNGEKDDGFIAHMGTLIPGLEQTIRQLTGLADRQSMIQLSTKQAEFLALQNQINPHFLYNTLDAIRGDALCIGAEALADTTEALSTFFRYTITNVGNLVTVEEELDNVDNYFRIQRYRFGDKMNLKVSFFGEEQKLKKMYCPKLSIQPIVENAIFHGLENKSEGGEVCINLEVIEEKLHIDIIDNGNGISEEQLLRLNETFAQMDIGCASDEKPDKKGGIALKNVCRRIRLLFGEEFGLYINSVVSIGTKVEMTLPVVFKNGEI